MFKRSVAFVFAVACLLLAAQAQALDDGAIDRWLESMEELQAWGERQDALDEDDFRADHPQDLDFENILAQTAREHDEVREIIRRHGYDDVGEWSAVGGRIFQALLAVQMEISPETKREIEQTIREMEENPNISREQKEQFRRQMEQQAERISAMFEDVPSDDVEAVERRMDDIMAVLE